MHNSDASAVQPDARDVDVTAATAANELLKLLYREPAVWSEITITAEDMPTVEQRRLFAVLERIHRRGEAPTKALVAAELEKLDPGADVSDWRIQMLQYGETPPRENLASYQEVIRTAAELHRLRVLRADLDRHLTRGDAKAAYATLQRALAKTADRGRRMTMREALWRVMEQLDQPDPPVPFGLEPLDDLLAGGLRPGDVFVLAARPSVGKSAFAGQVIIHVAQHVGPVALWSLEMGPEQWARRALSQRALVSSKKLRMGKSVLADDDLPRILSASAFLNTLPIHFADTSDTTPEGWELEASRMVREHAVRLLVIDYLGLMQPPPGAWSRENEVARHSRTIKLAAQRLRVPVLLLHQLSRDAEDKPPTLRHLRESGAIEQDADQVAFIHRDREQDSPLHKPEGLIILAKQRDGETGVVPVRFDGEHFRFYSMSGAQEPPELQARRSRYARKDRPGRRAQEYLSRAGRDE